MKSLSSLSRKGQINSLAPAVIALVIAAVFLVLGLIILQSLRDTDIVSKANTAVVTNETITTMTEAAESLSCASNPAGSCGAATGIRNATGASITSNLTQTGCSVQAVELSPFNNTNWYIDYTCTSGGEAWQAGNATVVGLGTFADFWEIIVLAVVISIVIGLLLLVFGGRRER